MRAHRSALLISSNSSRDRMHLTAWNLHTSQGYVSEEHSTIGCWFYVKKDKVVVVDLEFAPAYYHVYIWDITNSHRLQKIGGLSNLELWHVDADDNVLVTFEIDWDANPAAVQQTKWTLTGQLLDRKQYGLPLFGHRVNKKYMASRAIGYSRLHTFGHRTQKRVPYMVGEPNTMDLIYDYAIDKLSFRWNDCMQPSIKDLPSNCSVFVTPHTVYNWSFLRQEIEIFNDDDQTTTAQPYQPDFRENSVRVISSNLFFFDFTAIMASDRADLYLRPFGDREVFGMASEDGVQLWFFNPNFVPDIPGMEPFQKSGEEQMQ